MSPSEHPSAWVIDVAEPEFETAVVERSHQVPVVIDFWAPWCQPCRMLGPMLEKLAGEYDGKFLLAKVDIDQCPNLAQAFRISGIPQLVAIYGGKPVGQFGGVLPERQVRDFLESIIPSAVDKLLTEAAQQEESDPAAAKGLYRQVLGLDPRHSVASAALAELIVDDDPAAAAQLVANVSEGTGGFSRAAKVKARLDFQSKADDAGSFEECQRRVQDNPDDLNARLDLGLLIAAKGDYPQALETLVQIAEADRTFGQDNVRERMVQIFNIVGQQTELANTYRSRLSSAIY